jgi:histidinol-phosphate aminotransferase
VGAAALGAALVGKEGGGRLFALGRDVEGGVQAPAAAAGAIRIGSNEYPFGPGPHVVEAIEKALRDGNRYSRTPGDLTEAIAEAHGVKAENVLLTAGSGDLLRTSVLAFASPTAGLVAGNPTFESPIRTATARKVPMQLVPVKADLSFDLDAIAARSAGAGLVYLCNPNNPTGTAESAVAIKAMIQKVHALAPKAYVLIDEAYIDCTDDPAIATAIPQTVTDPQILVTRTFSKLHGMAGLRIGYAVAHPSTIAKLRVYAGQSVVSNVSAAAAMTSLADKTYYRAQQDLNRKTRDWTTAALTALGYPPIKSHANFVMVDVKQPSTAFQAACKEKGVLVARPFPPLTNYSRISIGTPEEMKTAMDVFEAVLGAKATATSAAARRG